MKVIFLGTGTSMGVPVIGCKCPVCMSDDAHDRRTRPSIYLEKEGFSLLIDSPPDMREQLLANDISNIDSIIITHAHADHVFGLDDTRIFSIRNRKPVDIFCSNDTENEIRKVFAYVFADTQKGGGKPSFSFHDLRKTASIGPFRIEAFKVFHGILTIDAMFIDDLCIIMDASYIDIEAFGKLKGRVRTLIINGLRHIPHSTHFSYSESAYLAKALQAEQAYIVHLSHSRKQADFPKVLPAGVNPAYDGLIIDLN